MIFKYKAFNVLLFELGRLDYTVEVIEIAIRDFLNNLEKSKSPNDYLKNKCEEHGIMVSYDESNNYYNNVVLANIANVYHVAEAFLYEVQREYNSISSTNWAFTGNTTKLDQVIEYFNGKGRINARDKIDEYLIDTFRYYHQLRVYFSHKKTTSLKEIERKWKKAVSHYSDDVLLKYKIKEPPKKIDDIDFEDYFLFTQIVKDIGLQISSIGYPEPAGFAEMKDIKSLKRFLDKPDRLKASVESLLKTKYGFVKQYDSDNLVDLIINSM